MNQNRKDDFHLTVDEIAAELHHIMEPVGFKISASALLNLLRKFAKEEGEDYPARYLTMAREARKFANTGDLASILSDLNFTGKQLVPCCKGYAIATVRSREEALNA